MDKSFPGDGRDLCRVRGAVIYGSSVIQRAERGRKDSDFIEVQPDATGSDPVQFQCKVNPFELKSAHRTPKKKDRRNPSRLRPRIFRDRRNGK